MNHTIILKFFLFITNPANRLVFSAVIYIMTKVIPKRNIEAIVEEAFFDNASI
jgi:hypothetical protein